jgi:hypothetical protein
MKIVRYTHKRTKGGKGMPEVRNMTIDEVINMMNLTNKELGEILGVSEITAQRKRKGQSEWTVTDLKIISERAQVPIAQITL